MDLIDRKIDTFFINMTPKELPKGFSDWEGTKVFATLIFKEYLLYLGFYLILRLVYEFFTRLFHDKHSYWRTFKELSFP